ncbi:MAG TPA: DMT family transporter [Candidatus Acidoferrales bacterium]|nr:DMT family transporter [Candidatus Acidoferrales bacterium]
MSIYFALQAGFFFACSHVLIRRGLVGSNALTGSLISLTSTALISGALALALVPRETFLTSAVWYFVLAGIFAPGLGRTLTYVGIERVGVARSVPIVNSSPMFASILAVFVLGERWSLQNFLGTSLVICGVVILSRSHAEKTDWRLSDLFLPIAGALAFAISSNLRKLGLEAENVPLAATAITATTAAVFLWGTVFFQGGWSAIRLTRTSFRWLLAAGISNSIATISVFHALSHGKVVVVEPLVAANPVLSILLTAIFLRDLEVINRRVVVGALLTVAGTILIVTL